MAVVAAAAAAAAGHPETLAGNMGWKHGPVAVTAFFSRLLHPLVSREVLRMKPESGS